MYPLSREQQTTSIFGSTFSSIFGARTKLTVIVMLLALSLVACGRSSANPAATPTTETALNVSTEGSELSNASLTLQPASGYGGLYIKITGDNWPNNMLVMVTLEDEQGRSETLAASDTDYAGNLNTGFLFPIDQRWLASESVSVVTTTADGRMETKAPFEVVEPGTVIATSSTSTSSLATSPINSEATTGASSSETAPAIENETDGETSESTGEPVAATSEQHEHTVVLPLIASTGPELRNSSRARRNSSNPTARSTSPGEIKVAIEIDPGRSRRIDCRDGEAWITIAILSSGSFDATRIDPGSVTVYSGSSDLGYGASATIPVAFHSTNKQEPAARTRNAYQWRWELDDVDGDGSIDMVMEFQLDYTSIDCGASVVGVSGRTKDGDTFEGTKAVDMRVVERS